MGSDLEMRILIFGVTAILGNLVVVFDEFCVAAVWLHANRVE